MLLCLKWLACGPSFLPSRRRRMNPAAYCACSDAQRHIVHVSRGANIYFSLAEASCILFYKGVFASNRVWSMHLFFVFFSVLFFLCFVLKCWSIWSRRIYPRDTNETVCNGLISWMETWKALHVYSCILCVLDDSCAVVLHQGETAVHWPFCPLTSFFFSDISELMPHTFF